MSTLNLLPQTNMELFIHILLLLIPILLFLCFFNAPKHHQKPGLKMYPIVGVLPDFLRNRHRFLEWTTDVLSACPTNTTAFSRPGGVRGVFTANPLNVEYMLKTNFENYPKGLRFISLLQDFLGSGIFNSDGDQWKTQRKTASHEFSTRSLRNFAMETARAELESRLIPILRDAAARNRVIDIQDILERFAFDNINKVAFNVDPGCLDGDGTGSGEFMRAFEDAATLSSGRFMYVIPFLYRVKKLLNMGSERKLQKSIKIVHEFADEIIASRMANPAEKTGEDLLSRFMAATGENSHSPKFLRDVVISFILAGRDTTSSALTWFFWLISSRPEVEQSILQELRKIRQRTGQQPGESWYGLDELREMHYLHAAISEAMRLYPPVPVDTKACQKDDVLPDGTFVGKGWFLTYHTYAMGRMESIWGADCWEYKPERWLEKGLYSPTSPFRFPVFHGGARMCLGKEMAYIQMKSIAAAVLERFEMNVMLEKGKVPGFVLSLTLRMKGGLPVMLRDRNMCK
ncbi:unnamed protein product [Cuscuta epithymum]|uniref:Uncharacterized protein n=1 Tax=Cuscuta epithymum TaxID=186058 RepID=A0AAV0FGQ0_9ASTE|nr:unnamed protein product [Cuscuta epithymum]